MRSISLALALGLAWGALAQEPKRDAVEPGKPAPDFTLVDTEGKEHRLSDLKGKVVVLEWFNPDCPYVVKHHQRHSTMRDTAARFADQGVVWLAINSGAEGMEGAGSGRERNQRAKEEWKIPWPILLDPDGAVGKAYRARSTPTMVVIDREGKVAYMGAIDDDPTTKTPGKTNYVARAIEALLAGEPVPEPTRTKAYGCGVKYR